MASSEPKANLYRVLKHAWGIESYAAGMLFAKGGVSIDGFVVPTDWAKGHWTEKQLAGRMLKCVRGEVRLYGSQRAPVIVDQQLELVR